MKKWPISRPVPFVVDGERDIDVVDTQYVSAIVIAHWMRVDMLKMRQIHPQTQMMIAVMIKACIELHLRLNCGNGNAILMVVKQVNPFRADFQQPLLQPR